MLHHDFSRAIIKDRVSRLQAEAEAELAEQAGKERPEAADRS